MSTHLLFSTHIGSFSLPDGRVGYALTSRGVTEGAATGQPEARLEAFGTREEIVDRIFAMAQLIPAGQLKAPAPNSLDFINGLMEQLKRPRLIKRTWHSLSNQSGEEYTDTINDTNRELIQSILVKHGHYERACAISSSMLECGDDIEIDLARDFDLVRDLLAADTGPGGLIRNWRMTEADGPSKEEPATGEWQPKVDLLQIPMSNGVARGSHHVCVLDGMEFCAGELGPLEALLIQSLGHLEKRHPGAYAAALSSFYQSRDNGPAAIDMDSTCHIDLSKIEPWQRTLLKADLDLVFGHFETQMSFTLAEMEEGLSKLGLDIAGGVRLRMMRAICDPRMSTIHPASPSERQPRTERDRG